MNGSNTAWHARCLTLLASALLLACAEGHNASSQNVDQDGVDADQALWLGQPPVLSTLDKIVVPGDEAVYLDPATLEHGDQTPSAMTGEIIEVLPTKSGWALRRARLQSECQPQHTRSTLVSLTRADGTPLEETELIQIERSLQDNLAYSRAITERLCAEGEATE